LCVAWWVTEKIIEARLSKITIDENANVAPNLGTITPEENNAFRKASLAMLIGIAILIALIIPEDSALRSPTGELTAFDAPLMKSIVPLIFIVFIVSGVIYGRISGKFKNGDDVIKSMGDTMGTMGSYIVMSFFCAQFLVAFGQSNIGVMLALYGAEFLHALNMPGQLTIVGMIFLTVFVNLLVGSASAKWALIAPILVPMLLVFLVMED